MSYMGREFSRNSQSYTEARSSYVGEQQRKSAMKKHVEKIVIFVLLAASAVVCAGGFVFKSSSENRIESEINPQIEILKQELEQKKKHVNTNDSGHVVRYEDAIVSSARDKGSEVCEYQNMLSEYTLRMRRTGESRLSEEHQKLLETYRALIVDPPANMKGTWCEFGTWQFDSTFDFEGTRMQVVWRCYDGDELLAVAMGTYDAELGRFLDMKLLKTVYYQQAVIDNPIVTTTVTETDDIFVTTLTPDEHEITDSSHGTDITSDTTREPDVSIVTSYDTIVSSETTSEGEVTTYSSTSDTTTSVPVSVYSESTIIYEYPEDQWFYGWSVEYQCWGYFDQSGNFMTEEEYQRQFGW